MLLASQSGRIFSESVRATGKATLKDQISISISSDLEQVRNMTMLWKADQTNMRQSGLPINGEMVYTPTDAMCEDNSLAKDLLLSSDMAGEGTLSRTTLVWTAGQDGWKQAEDVIELAQLFTILPPPLPPPPA